MGRPHRKDRRHPYIHALRLLQDERPRNTREPRPTETAHHPPRAQCRPSWVPPTPPPKVGKALLEEQTWRKRRKNSSTRYVPQQQQQQQRYEVHQQQRLNCECVSPAPCRRCRLAKRPSVYLPPSAASSTHMVPKKDTTNTVKRSGGSRLKHTNKQKTQQAYTPFISVEFRPAPTFN